LRWSNFSAARILRLLVPALDPLGQLDLLGRRQQRVAPGLVQEELQGVGRGRREVPVHVGAVGRLLAPAVVTDLQVALLRGGVERLELRVLGLELLNELVQLREVHASLLFAVLQKCRQLLRHRSSYPHLVYTPNP
jgi:hypothetical protein